MTCLATGFLPKEIEMSIRRKGTPVSTAQHHHIYPNGDGTHQARLHVDVSMSEANDYDCYVYHRTLSAPAVSKWETGNDFVLDHMEYVDLKIFISILCA